MNKFVAFVAAGVLSASALVAGTASAENGNSAFAQMVEQNTYGTPAPSHSNGAVGYGYNAGFITRAAHQGTINIRYVSELSQSEKVAVVDRAKADPAAVQALQSEIAQNSALVRGLQERNLKVSDVIGANKALDGSTTYIIR